MQVYCLFVSGSVSPQIWSQDAGPRRLCAEAGLKRCGAFLETSPLGGRPCLAAFVLVNRESLLSAHSTTFYGRVLVLIALCRFILEIVQSRLSVVDPSTLRVIAAGGEFGLWRILLPVVAS